MTKKIEQIANSQEKSKPKIDSKNIPLNRRATMMPVHNRKLQTADSLPTQMQKRLSASPGNPSAKDRKLTQRTFTAGKAKEKLEEIVEESELRQL